MCNPFPESRKLKQNCQRNYKKVWKERRGQERFIPEGCQKALIQFLVS